MNPGKIPSGLKYLIELVPAKVLPSIFKTNLISSDSLIVFGTVKTHLLVRSSNKITYKVIMDYQLTQILSHNIAGCVNIHTNL